MLDLGKSFNVKTIMIINRFEQRVSIAAPAKVNLYLELLGKRSDGFHELETVMVNVDLFDQLSFSKRRDEKIALRSNEICKSPHPITGVAWDEQNLIYRAVDLVRQRCGVRLGVDVAVQKNIPAQAGLGGASSNAAATLVAVNELWQLNLDRSELLELAAELGSDVSFFLGSGSAVCTGRGEQVENLNYPGGVPLVIAKPPEGNSTAEIYSRCEIPAQPMTSKVLLRSLKLGNLHSIGQGLFNRLEQFADEISQWIQPLKESFQRVGALGHQLTGSGSCYFGIFPSLRTARLATVCLKSRMPDVRFYCCSTIRQFDNRPGLLRQRS